MTSEQQAVVDKLRTSVRAYGQFEHSSGFVTMQSYAPRRPYDPNHNSIKTYSIQIDGTVECDGNTIDVNDL